MIVHRCWTLKGKGSTLDKSYFMETLNEVMHQALDDNRKIGARAAEVMCKKVVTLEGNAHYQLNLVFRVTYTIYLYTSYVSALRMPFICRTKQQFSPTYKVCMIRY